MLFLSGAAQATPCTITIAAKVTPSDACETGSGNQDFKNDPMTVNTDEMFGFDDWVFAQRDDDADGTDTTDIDIGFLISGDVVSGSWDIDSDFWSTYSNLMLVFKGGNTNYVGYLITEGAITGTYSSPLVKNSDQFYDISHISAYVRGPSISIPEPGTLGLLGLGLLGLAIRRRNKA